MKYKKGDILKYNGKHIVYNVKVGTRAIVTEDFNPKEDNSHYVQIKWVNNEMRPGFYYPSSFDLVITREQIQVKKNRLKKGDEVVGVNNIVTSIDNQQYNFFTEIYIRTIHSIDYKNGWLILTGDEDYDKDSITNLPGLKFPINQFKKYVEPNQQQEETIIEESIKEEQNTNNMENQNNITHYAEQVSSVYNEVGSDCEGQIMNHCQVQYPIPGYEYQEHWEVNIKTLNHGYVVSVGCKSFAIESKERMLKLLNDYYTNPKETVDKFNKGTLFIK